MMCRTQSNHKCGFPFKAVAAERDTKRRALASTGSPACPDAEVRGGATHPSLRGGSCAPPRLLGLMVRPRLRVPRLVRRGVCSI